jgi:hypothetical protein
LAPLAALSMHGANIRKARSVLYTFVIWQFGEVIFRTAYFKNLLTNLYISRGELDKIEITNMTFGVIGLFRYLSIITFTITLLEYFKIDRVRLLTEKFSRKK